MRAFELAAWQNQAAPVAETELAAEVQRTLADYLDIRLADCADLDPAFAEAARELVDFALGGGKRIRPTFTWWGWRAAGGEPDSPEARAVLRAATSLELIQACALAHDDLIDDSDTRRGRPTIHRRFSATHVRSGYAGSSDRFGKSAAILLGDLALVWSDDMLHSAGLGTEALERALPAWRAMRTEVLAGQYIDVLAHARGDETAASALRVGELKSASYTVRRPLEIGARIGGASATTFDALARFGSDIGIAFQLRDDLLGVFGDPAHTGKPAGDDLREGKRTLLIAEGLQRAEAAGDHSADKLIQRVLGDPDLQEADVELVRDVLIELGAVRAVEDRILELSDSAVAALDDADISEAATETLAQLAIQITNRSR